MRRFESGLYAIDAGYAQLVRGRRNSRVGSAAGPEAWPRSATDEGEGIDLSAVTQHLEVHVRPGGVAGGPHERHGFTALHRLTDAHQRALVVRVAGDEAVAVTDLDELAETRPLAGPGDDAGGDRDHPVTDGPGEIDALVERLAAIEGIGARAEIGGNKAPRDRAAFGVDLRFQLARENHVLERRELRVARIYPLLELAQHGGEIGDLRAHPLTIAFRAAAGRIACKIELAAVDIRHFGEALAEGIETDDVCVHGTQAHRHGVDAQLQLLPEVGELVFLLGEQAPEAQRVAEHPALIAAAAELHTERKDAPENHERQSAEDT